MPVYNAETFLHRSIKSIINQTYQNWELIIIDDGSTDNSSLICDSYANCDNRIRVIHKKNEGVSVARQLGINEARGEYSIHCDADDWVEPNMLEDLYKLAKYEDSDIVISDYFINQSKKEIIRKQDPKTLDSHKILLKFFSNELLGSLWNKLIRTKLYKTYNITFFTGIDYCEDLLICVQLFSNSNLKISYIPNGYYHYFMNNSSITHNYTRRTYVNQKRFKEKLNEILNIEEKEQIINKVSFDIFTQGVIFKILNEEEINSGLKTFKHEIKKIKSIKWQIGFYFLSMGMYKIASKFIHY